MFQWTVDEDWHINYLNFRIKLRLSICSSSSSGRKATRGISSQELGQGLSGEEQDGASGGVTGDIATGVTFLSLLAFRFALGQKKN